MFVNRLWIACLLAVACTDGTTKTEGKFQDDLRRLDGIIREYNDIPQMQKTAENKGNIDIVFWKDKEQLNKYYVKHKGDFVSIDASLKHISEKTDNILFDDALFARGILYSLWAQVDRNADTVQSAIAILRDFVNLSPSMHIEESTKKAVQNSYWNAYRDFSTPSLSYEDNVRILFYNNIGYLLTILKQYDAAAKEYETIVNKYPTSKFATHAQTQIQILRDIAEGKNTSDSSPP